MAFGTVAFDTLQTSDSKKTGTNKTHDTSFVYNGSAKVWHTGAADGASAEDSFNMSSLTDTATGKQTININSDMSNIDYSAMATCNNNTLICSRVSSKATGSYASTMTTPGNTDTDVRNSTTVHGDLA